MTVKQMIELVQQHHPQMGETEIIKMLNLAMADFSIRTKMMKDVILEELNADQRYYSLSDEILEITRVDMDTGDGYGKQIPRLMTVPTEMDAT